MASHTAILRLLRLCEVSHDAGRQQLPAGAGVDVWPVGGNLGVGEEVMGRCVIGVGGIVSAAHRDATSGALHGHTWEVTAWFRRGTDITIRQCRLDSILKQIDHTELPCELAWGEDIAEWVARKFDDSSCVAVDVARPLERFYARWERADD